MAVPDSVSMRNYGGTYGLNKTLSDNTDPVLRMQGIGWLVRKAIQVSNVTLEVKQYADDAGAVHIDIETVSTGNMRSTETRTCDNAVRAKDDRIFGKVEGRTRFVRLGDVADGYLKEGWATRDPGDADVVETWVESVGEDPWTAEQIWGFAVVEGGRRHVRKLVVGRGSEVHRIRIVYDWIEV